MNHKPIETTAVLLAAGRGKRMRALTENTPKPLLKVGNLSLIEHHLYRLSHSGFRKAVINVDYLGQQIIDKLGDGTKYGIEITFSDESSTGALETAGGINNALPLINSDPFLVLNSDIWTDFDFQSILTPLRGKARLMMVENPSHNVSGDFSFSTRDSKLCRLDRDRQSHTFAGVGLYRKSIFSCHAKGRHPLAPILFELASTGELEGLIHEGVWTDVGTPERLSQVAESISD